VRSRSVVWLVALAFAAGACGQAEPDNPTAALIEYVEAVRESDDDRLRILLSSRWKRQVEVDPDRFIAALSEDLEGVGDHVVLSEKLEDRLAVVALERDSQPGAFAAPVVREGDLWRIEPFGLDLVYGTSAADGVLRASPRELEFGVNAPAELKKGVSARLWLDGKPLELTRATEGAVEPTFVARPPQLEPGRHRVVVYAQTAEADPRRGAIAWAFTVSG
jgi:hypothetical protein